MSFAQFDDFYEICCGRMEEDEKSLFNAKGHKEATVMVNDADVKKWWEEALKEIERESANEYELYPI